MVPPPTTKQDNFLMMWNFMKLRNPNSIGPVIFQCFMVLSSCLIIFGLLYVFFLVLAIIIHHFYYDRDPRKVPQFVRKSVQFSSDSEDSEIDECIRREIRHEDRKSKVKVGDFDTEGGERSEESISGQRLVRSHSRVGKNSITSIDTVGLIAKKAAALDKFLNIDMDIKKN